MTKSKQRHTPRHHRHQLTNRKPPPNSGGPTQLNLIVKELRKDNAMATPFDVDPARRRATVGPDAPIKHAEPDLELDADAIEEVATAVVENTSGKWFAPSSSPQRDFTPIARIDGVHRDVETFVLELAERLEVLESEVAKLRERVRTHKHSSLEEKQNDGINDQIIEMLTAISPVKLTSGSVAANLGIATTVASNRMRHMVSTGKIKSITNSSSSRGGVSYFWIERKAD